MSIKIYNVNGIGLVIGEKISQDSNFVYLQYPGIFVQHRTQQGQPQNVMIEPVPPIFKGRDEMLRRLPIKKAMIIYGGQPTDETRVLYEEYAAQLRVRIMGLEIVDRADFNGKE